MSDLHSGGLGDTIWVRCQVASSFKDDEAVVRIETTDLGDVTFFIERSLVRIPSFPAPGDEADGLAQGRLIESLNGHVILEIPGEPLSFGPKITVPREAIEPG